jgi:Uma2 family endonuclease
MFRPQGALPMHATVPAPTIAEAAEPVAAPHPITAEQLEEIARDRTHRYELVRGELITMSPTGGQHGRFVYQLTIALGQFASEHEQGSLFGA